MSEVWMEYYVNKTMAKTLFSINLLIQSTREFYLNLPGTKKLAKGSFSVDCIMVSNFPTIPSWSKYSNPCSVIARSESSSRQFNCSRISSLWSSFTNCWRIPLSVTKSSPVGQWAQIRIKTCRRNIMLAKDVRVNVEFVLTEIQFYASLIEKKDYQ